MKKISIFLMMILVISLFLAGCGDGKKTPAKTEENPPISNQTSQGKEGGQEKAGENKAEISSESKGVAIPEEFPIKVVPILEGGKIVHSMKNDNANAINLSVETKKSKDEVVEFYRGVLKGGKNSREMDTADAVILTAVKDGYVIAVTVMEQNGITMMNIDVRKDVN